MASPAQMDRDRKQLNFSNRPRVDSFNIPSSKKTNDSASFANYVSPKKTNDSASFANYISPKKTNDSASFANFLTPVNNSNNNSGINAFGNNYGGGQSGSNMNPAQAVLGPLYSKAISVGMSPAQINDQLSYAQGFGRGINLSQFKDSLDKYDAFQNMDGNILKYENEDGTFTNYGNVSDPMITANAPTTGQFFGDIASGIGNFMKTGADFVMGGGTMGEVLGAIKEKFSQGKDFVGEMRNPGNINERVDALSPEQRRIYAMYMSQGMPYQQAFEQATGQAFSMGGITSLN